MRAHLALRSLPLAVSTAHSLSALLLPDHRLQEARKPVVWEDLSSGTFHAVNNETGEHVPCDRDGRALPRFHLDVSGIASTKERMSLRLKVHSTRRRFAAPLVDLFLTRCTTSAGHSTEEIFDVTGARAAERAPRLSTHEAQRRTCGYQGQVWDQAAGAPSTGNRCTAMPNPAPSCAAAQPYTKPMRCCELSMPFCACVHVV